MNLLLRWLRRLSASDTAVRAVEQSLLDWKHEVDEAPGVLGAFASDFRMTAAIVRLIVGVVLHDIADAFRGGYGLRLLLWNLLGTLAVGIAFSGSLHPAVLENLSGFFVAALPYTVIVLIASARKRPPAIGVFFIVAAVAAAGFAVFKAASPWPRSWFMFAEWLVLPALCILLADRIRQEARPNVQLMGCAVGWIVGRAIQMQIFTYAGGVYRPWIAWISVAVPFSLWLFFVWKQDRTEARRHADEVTV